MSLGCVVFDSTIPAAATSSTIVVVLLNGMSVISFFFGDVTIEVVLATRRVSFLGERFGEWLLDDKSPRGDRIVGDNLFDAVFIGLLFGNTVVEFAVIFDEWLLRFDNLIPPLLW